MRRFIVQTKLRELVVAVLAMTGAACADSERGSGADAYPPDSPQARAEAWFHCGSLSGAVQGSLMCNHEFPNLSWTWDPGYAGLEITAYPEGRLVGPDAAVAAMQYGFGMYILTGYRMSVGSVSCTTLPALPANQWTAFEADLAGPWTLFCGQPGASFELDITSIGTLSSDTIGADPLDATPDSFPWDGASQEIDSNSFHGTLKATFVDPDAGPPIYMSLTF